MHAPLNALDRCDRCGAQAYAVTQHTTLTGEQGTLLWCVHHLDEHPEVLADLIHDETSLVRPKEPARA